VEEIEDCKGAPVQKRSDLNKDVQNGNYLSRNIGGRYPFAVLFLPKTGPNPCGRYTGDCYRILPCFQRDATHLPLWHV